MSCTTRSTSSAPSSGSRPVLIAILAVASTLAGVHRGNAQVPFAAPAAKAPRSDQQGVARPAALDRQVRPHGSEVLRGVLPVVGSTPGGFGSFFRTSFQISHPGLTEQPITVRIVFRRAGVAGSDADEEATFTIRPREVFAYSDIVESMGITGLGSLDLFADEDLPIPIVSVRVYNDAGAAGTSGLSEPLLTSQADSGVIGDERVGYLIAPILPGQDPGRTRFNIGVRTLEAASVTFVLYDPVTQLPRSSVTREYPGSFFEQVSAESVLGPIEGNELISISSTGLVIVYGSTTDNITNDPAVQLAVVR